MMRMIQGNSEIKSGHVKLEICVYKGTLKLSSTPGDLASYCRKQYECPDEVHRNLDCKNCPDFKAYEYDWYST